MAIFKILDGKYNKQGDISRLVLYMLNPQKVIHGIYGARGLFLGVNVEDIEKQFRYIRELANKTEIQHHAYHFVVGFDKWYEKWVTLNIAKEIGINIGVRVLDNYPYFFVVHEEPYLHIHFMISAIGFNGEVFENKQTTHAYIARELSCCYSNRMIEYSLCYDNNERCSM